MKIIAIIPARAGSKSIPNKNIKELAGKPLIAYSIESAIASSSINDVIVSTDSPTIATIAKSYGAKVPCLRPAEISGDHALDYEYLNFTLLNLEPTEMPDMVVLLRPTHPLRLVATIERAIAEYKQNFCYDSLRSVRIAEQSPFKMWYINETENKLEPIVHHVAGIKGEPFNSPRQLLPKTYWQDGYIDIIKPSTIFEKKSSTGDHIYPFIITENTMDVDYPEEFENLEKKITSNKNPGTKTKERFPS